LVELETWKNKFQEQGINVAAMTYDSSEISRKFVNEQNLTYPFLKDENAKHVIAYKILNESYNPGDPGYGVPHPGVLYITEDGVVAFKLASPGFRDRPSFQAIYDGVSSLQ
jgi:peroxiredoxin